MPSHPLNAPARLAELRERGLHRDPRHVDGPQTPEIRVDGRTVVCLCSNNYLGLAADPALADAMRNALEAEGAGAGASRLISGTMAAHRAAEARLARFVGLPSALLFSTGYAANVGAIQALVDRHDVIFSDALNHASLIDGCRLSRATTHVYRHADPDHLEHLLRAHRADGRQALVVTDALFSMDGDRAALGALRGLCDRHDAALLVDEAHALGVLGPQGAGACAEAGVQPDVLVGTLGKAFGVAGAFVAADRDVTQLIANLARSFVFSTAPPPVVAAAATRAADVVSVADERRARLQGHARRLRRGLRAIGYDVPEGDTPILPVRIGDPRRTMEVSAALLERGVFAHGIRPPTVPEGTSRVRVVPMATHTEAHIDRVLQAFGDLAARRAQPLSP